jgi:hypothetical protein
LGESVEKTESVKKDIESEKSFLQELQNSSAAGRDIGIKSPYT